MLSAFSPYPQFFDLDGLPLDAGSLYFGVEDLNPETDPITVYWDAEGTQPAAQPVRTINGYTVRAGTPATVYADGAYSLTVYNAKRRRVFYSGSASDGVLSALQRNKIDDLASIYRAVGDGATSDTAAFAALEAAVQGRDVDLAGRTYAVAALPQSNRYYNGFFRIGPVTYAGRRGSKRNTQTVLRDLNAKGAKLVHTLTRKAGVATVNNVVQSYARDEANAYQFSHAITEGLGPDPGGSGVIEAAVVQRYPLGVRNITAVTTSLPNWKIGHQGLDVEQCADGTTRLWASKAENGQIAIRCRYVADGELADLQEYRLFAGSASTGSVTPCISYGQGYLVAKYNTDIDTAYKVRVFDLAELVAGGPGDYSTRYVREFDVGAPLFVDDGKDFQDLAYHEELGLFVIAGANTLAETTRVGQWTPEGEFVGMVDLQVGRGDAAITGAGTTYEPESITFGTHNGQVGVFLQICMGDSGLRISRVYFCGVAGARRSGLDFYEGALATTTAAAIVQGGENGSILLIADSIGNGVGTPSSVNGIGYRVGRSVMNAQDKGAGRRRGRGYHSTVRMGAWAVEPGHSHNGTIIAGGASTERLQLTTGQYLEITGREFSRIAAFYDKASTAGNLAITRNGGAVSTLTLTGGTGVGVTALTNVNGGSLTATGDTVRLTATGGTVVVTTITETRAPDAQPFMYSCCVSGTSYEHYNTAAKLDELAMYLNAFVSSVEPKAVLLLLGTNSIGSGSVNVPPATMIANARGIIAGLRSRVDGLYVAIQVPMQAQKPVQQAGYTFQDYRDAVIEFAQNENHGIVRADWAEPSVNYALLDDDTHPNLGGYRSLNATICRQLGIAYDWGL